MIKLNTAGDFGQSRVPNLQFCSTQHRILIGRIFSFFRANL